MKFSVVFVFIFYVVSAVVSAFPSSSVQIPKFHIKVAEETPEENFDGLAAGLAIDESPEEVGVRFRRATCDLLSFDTKFGSLNHSACAAHCLAMRKGFRGGRCRDGVCHCRK